ncbi:MAG TPA: hypothetical protein VGW34_00650 [Allosphingosinicella sp.]|nr:hypothetical protein [Allosphingosinicella sp.]
MNTPSESVSRRKLLVGLTGAAVAAGAVAAPGVPLSLLASQKGAGEASWWEREYWTLEGAGAEEWKAQIGHAFRIAGNKGAQWLRLVEVEALASPGRRPRNVARRSAFSVVFEATQPVMIGSDRIFAVGNRSYSGMRIFLTRTGIRRLQGIFN